VEAYRVKIIPCNRLWRTIGLRFSSVAVEACRVEIIPCNRPWRPIGLLDVKDPTLNRQPALRWW
jgi:hypothetical protein